MTKNPSQHRRHKIDMIQKMNNRKPQPIIGSFQQHRTAKQCPQIPLVAAKLPIMIAAWLLVAVIALIGSGLTGNAHAQAGSDVIPSITLDSNQPGQLVITWETPEQAPTDYRVRWANTSLGFPVLQRFQRSTERANVYPARRREHAHDQ